MNPNSQVTFSASKAARREASGIPRQPATRRRSQAIEAAKPTSVTEMITRSACRAGRIETRPIVARCPAQFGRGSHRTV